MSRYFLFLLFFLLVSSVQAKDYLVGFGASSGNATWTATSGTNEYQSRSRFINLNASLRFQKFYTGLNLGGGEFTFTSTSPKHPDSVATDVSAVLQRGTFDLIGGYQFWRPTSVFLGVKRMNVTWPSGDVLSWSGVGGGFRFHHGFAKRWLLHGTLGLTPVFVDANQNLVGRGGITSASGGITWLIGKTMQLGLLLRSETISYTIRSRDRKSQFGSLALNIGVTF
jgi:hypothetical protein